MCEDDLVPYIMRQLNSDLTIVEEKTQSEKADKAQEAKQPCESDFTAIKTISKGAYGIVLLVRYKGTNRKFAMKKISKQRMVQKKLVPQVYAERDILSLAENPFIVSLLCTFSTKKHYCLVMEYVEGGDVASLIEKVGTLPVDMARMYFSEAVLALEYVHSYGIVHRDLKPDNMLITSEGHIKLTDFGLSKIGLVTFTATLLEDNIRSRLTENHFKESTVWGTPDYIAPEVILGLEYDKAVDWWSMGVILYEMLEYFKPFKANTVDELFDIITNEAYELTWVDEELVERPPKAAEDLIKKLLTYQPKKRLGSTEQGGIEAVKSHPFFNGLDWNNLLRIKAEFVPQLEGEYDTSYFDTREERYPDDYESDVGEEETTGEPGYTRFATTSIRFSRLLENEDLDEYGDLTIAPCPPSYPKQESKGLIDSPSEKSLPDLMILSDKDDEKSTEDEGLKHVDDEELVKLLSPSNQRPDSLFPCNTPTDSEQDIHSLDIIYLPRTSKANNIAMLSASEPELSYVCPESNTTDLDRVDEIEPPVRYRSHTKSTSSTQLEEMTLKPHPPVTFSSKSPRLKRRPRVSKSKPSNIPSPSSPHCQRRRFSDDIHSKQIEVEKCQNEFGFAVRGIRVYMKNSNNFQTDHLATRIVEGGPADGGGLKENDLITHINKEEIRGYSHNQVAALLAHNKKVLLTIIPLHESSIQKDFKKKESADLVRISKKSKLLKDLFHTKKKKGSFFKINFPLSHKTSSASSTSSEKSGSHNRVPSFTSSVSNVTSPIAHGSPVHMMKTYHKKRPTPVSPLARTPSPSSLYRSTSLNLSQQKDNHLMPPTQQTGVRVTPSKRNKTIHPTMRMHNIHSDSHSRVSRSRSQTNSDLKDAHQHTSSLDCSLPLAPNSHSPVATPRQQSPEAQTVLSRPRSATSHAKSPQRHSHPVYFSNL
ncbi:Microtubule-associated serine/threonine-protein kinase 3-like [Oopsacas minuta]|uniref:non-specific serine/threonine protein kinase n=1 Tax=Oopsacas minuta TaxID=111878 RepID=A0AAV7K7G8_9METZ|nr:Microtubule-associated serine/threonine-protein kinase 3-like [Oopsacas minuta]